MINTLLHIYMYFVYPFSHWWASGLFPPSGFCEQCAAMNILMQVFNYLFSTLLGIYPKVEFLGHCSLAKSCLTLCDPWTAACQASLSSTISQSLLKLTSIESVMPSNHFIHCHPLVLLSSICPSIRVFFNESFFESDGQIIGASASA